MSGAERVTVNAAADPGRIVVRKWIGDSVHAEWDCPAADCPFRCGCDYCPADGGGECDEHPKE